jgi:hypothetical protein
LTYTLGVTLSGNTAGNPVVTDTLPSKVVFAGFGTVGAGNAVFQSGVSMILWTLPAPLPPGVYQLTYQVKVNPMVAGGTDVVNDARLDSSELPGPLDAAATVRMTGSYRVLIGVYNEAGERIKEISVLQLSAPLENLELKGNVLTRLQGPGGTLEIYSQGCLLGTWDGTDSAGDPVTNGVYHIQVDNIDPYGVVTTVTREATVSRSLARVSVEVFNEAGEVVKHLQAWTDDPDGSEMTNVTLNTQAILPGGGAGNPSSVLIGIGSSTMTLNLSWDGTNDGGRIVSPGHYELEVHWKDGQGGVSDISRGILVLGSGRKKKGTVTAQPNLLRLSAGVHRTKFTAPADPGLTLRARIYTLDGELASDIRGGSGTDEVFWDASGYASGLYLAVVDLLDSRGGLKERETLKILVLR